jgi:GNAT superfamily N-acetyltransferase
MQIKAARAEDVPEAAACAAEAFSADQVMAFFFDDSPIGRHAATVQFFGLILEARIALGLPALVAWDDARVIGLAMGDDTTDAEWPAHIDRRWTEFESRHPGIADRFATYESIVEQAGLDRPHHGLGVIGVAPDQKGTGIGTALVQAFLDQSDRDSASEGTRLETATPSNLAFYRRFGFEDRACGALGKGTLWVMYRPKPATRI